MAEQRRTSWRSTCKGQLEQLHTRALAAGAAGRSLLEHVLSDRLVDLKDQCDLTEPQVKKLDLAGKGDIKRFADRMASLRRKIDDPAASEDDLHAVFSECDKLKVALDAGLFGEGSLLSKALARTLSPEQAVHREQTLAQRKLERYERLVWSAAKSLQGNMGLRDSQTEQLVHQILARTRPPKKFGQVFEFALVLFQLSRIPEDTIRPIFDDRQWRALEGWLAPYRARDGGAKVLEQDGFVFEDDASPPNHKLAAKAAIPADSVAKTKD